MSHMCDCLKWSQINVQVHCDLKLVLRDVSPYGTFESKIMIILQY